MRDYLTLGPTPPEESCEPNNGSRARVILECRVWKRQLQRMFPDGYFVMKEFPHDLGTYREVVIYYDTEIRAQIQYAYYVDGNLPAFWDHIAKIELMPRYTREDLEKDLVAGPESRY